ncbi:MAG: hypothetical protein FWH04_06065 [Oscillospiraceae bacterium]|nr:hypothetical protein [Oscillospiraceae bacterium]
MEREALLSVLPECSGAVLFVCTGNTCRSPLAQVLYQKIHPEWAVFSRGLMVGQSQPASECALEAAHKHGCDLSGHLSRQVTLQDVLKASRVYGVTEAHVLMLRQQFPEQAGKISPLSHQDIHDPFGGDIECYCQVASTLQKALEAL